MIWSIETDDFRGKCGNGQFPLLRSIRKGLNNQVVENPPEGQTIPTTSTTTPTTISTSSTTPSTSITTSSTQPSSTSSTSSASSTSSTSSTSSQQTQSTTVDPFSSTTSTTTISSPVQSTTPDPDAFVCKEEGFFKGSDCATFYRCVYIGEENSKYRLFVFHCPAGTVFDEKTDLCVWPSSVAGCEHFYGDSNHI